MSCANHCFCCGPSLNKRMSLRVHAVSIVLRNVFCCFSACQEQICILITSEDGVLKRIEDSLLLFLGFPESLSLMCL